MIWNIIDRRKSPYRWKLVTAIIEATWHDNGVPDSDQAERDDGPTYEEKAAISVADAITWAQAEAFPVTLYLYDLGKGINVASRSEVQALQRTKTKH